MQDTTSADSSTDLFEAILSDAKDNLIMNEEPWLSGQPCRETKNHVSHQFHYQIRQRVCESFQTKRVKNLVKETLLPAWRLALEQLLLLFQDWWRIRQQLLISHGLQGEDNSKEWRGLSGIAKRLICSRDCVAGNESNVFRGYPEQKASVPGDCVDTSGREATQEFLVWFRVDAAQETWLARHCYKEMIANINECSSILTHVDI